MESEDNVAKSNPSRAVADLVAHIVAHEERRDALKARTGGGAVRYEAPTTEVQIRGQLMQDVLDALGLTKVQLQSMLMIDKATWDRWRSIKTIPSSSHLETLARFAQEAEQKASKQTRPSPYDMLALGPKTWGRLRLVYSYYAWDNAVFNFLEPFDDEPTATEMALLALRDCRLVYFMDKPEPWRTNFRKTLVKILGTSYAARALSQFCIITPAVKDIPGEFGVFNYEAKAVKDRAGYRWKWNGKGRPSDSTEGVYDPVLGEDELFLDLHDKYDQLIHGALNKINERGHFWSLTIDRQQLLEIPVVTRETTRP